MDEVKKFFVDAFHHLGRNRPLPAIDVRFYPYAGLHHTIRLRSGSVHVRLSDICKDCSARSDAGTGVCAGGQTAWETSAVRLRTHLSRIFDDA